MTALAIHGGAGALPQVEMTPAQEEAYHSALYSALMVGQRLLAAGESSLNAVEAAVIWMENCPLFNAGRGSAFTRDGHCEMEAAVMDGRNRAAGSTALLRKVRNPVRLAHAVMVATPHVTLAGPAAEDFAAIQGLPLESPEYFFTRDRYEAMLKLRGTTLTALSEDTVVSTKARDEDVSGTVGAVALDRAGSLAAATSSGGTTNKFPGRIGQSALIGAGIYASNHTCAVVCTGQGEAFTRMAAAFDVSALMDYRGLDVAEAARLVIHERLDTLGGRGGLVAVDRTGKMAMPYNSGGMYRGWIDSDGRAHTAIYQSSRQWT